MILKSKDYIDELLDMSDPPDTNNCPSEVVQYYMGRNILITGSSGFLGILLIERLLRCCSDIGKMYICMKGKKGKSAEERFKEHFDGVVYDRLKKAQPDFISKVIMIETDFSEANLGLSPENRKRLLDTNIIFHLAASIRFNGPIRNSVNVNVRATKEILSFAKEMPNLEAFVYISTAFCQCVHSFIDEKYYPPPLETDKLLTLLDVLDDEMLNKITPTLVGKWPNIYVFSKAVAEDTVRQYSVGVPACIIRPSVVTSTAKEPVPGWINNIYGAVGIVVGSAMGLLRTLHCIPENTAEIIPADYVISNIIVAGWDIAKRKNVLINIDNTNSNIPETERIPIYNCVSSNHNSISWKTFMEFNEKYGKQVPSTKVFWYYMFRLNRYRFVHELSMICLHLIPGAIFDALALLTGRKPMLLKAYKKIHSFTDVTSYFSTRQWQFRNDFVIKLWDSLNETDREIFNFDIQNLCWEEYLKNMIPGIRLYFINDPIDTLEEGAAKMKKLKIAHYTLLTTISILLIWAIVSMISFIITFFE